MNIFVCVSVCVCMCVCVLFQITPYFCAFFSAHVHLQPCSHLCTCLCLHQCFYASDKLDHVLSLYISKQIVDRQRITCSIQSSLAVADRMA